MRKSIRFAGQAGLVVLLGLLVGASCRKAPAERPQLTLHFKATTPAGEPLPGVSVEAKRRARPTPRAS